MNYSVQFFQDAKGWFARISCDNRLLLTTPMFRSTQEAVQQSALFWVRLLSRAYHSGYEANRLYLPLYQNPHHERDIVAALQAAEWKRGWLAADAFYERTP